MSHQITYLQIIHVASVTYQEETKIPIAYLDYQQISLAWQWSLSSHLIF